MHGSSDGSPDGSPDGSSDGPLTGSQPSSQASTSPHNRVAGAVSGLQSSLAIQWPESSRATIGAVCMYAYHDKEGDDAGTLAREQQASFSVR